VPSRKKLREQLKSPVLKIGLEEHLQSQEDEDFGPYTSGLMKGVDTKGLECGKDDKNGGPSVIEREW
jgi:hypothetical protein